MELILRAFDEGGGDDVVIDADPSHTIGELAAALGRHLGLGDGEHSISHLRTGLVLDPDDLVGASGLMSGDDVVVGAPHQMARMPAIPVRAVTLDVVAGPDTGTSLILLQGCFAVGRDGAAVRLSDPTVSRHHLDVEVAADWTIAVEPRPGVENPVRLNDVPLTERVVVGPDDVVHLGASGLAFRPFVRAPSERIDRLGQVEFQRTPYRLPVVAERAAAELGVVPKAPEPRRFQLLTAIAPLGAGLTLFAFSRQPQFLALTLMTPLVFVANWIEDRRTGKRRFRQDSARFREAVERRRGELSGLVIAERVERRRAAPDLAELARRAELRTADLWARGRAADDFLRLRVGLGRVPSLVTADVDRGGDDELREEAIDAGRASTTVDGVPLTVDLVTSPVIGLHGATDGVTDVAAALVIQAACLHSPEDLTIVAMLDQSRSMVGWLKWLPHLRSVTSPLAGAHVASDHETGTALLHHLAEVGAHRRARSERERESRNWPRILAVVDARVGLDPATLAQVLDDAGDAAISVVWLADSAAEIPRQAGEVVAIRASGLTLSGTLWSIDPAVPDRQVDIERIRVDVAAGIARSMAPVRDASTASLATSIPRTAPLLDVLGGRDVSAQWVIDRWSAPRSYGLACPVGIGAHGVFELDLVADGPHALIGGTSGAGKSELLQSIVAGLASRTPPTHLNFLFVDYKGGASSNVFAALPHTVGYVTNLSAELSRRALTSLRAELDRRMRLLEGRAKDLAEMLERHPDDAPASLVIVVDEFATLVKEVPDFVAGMVDIAQRGRSLGIHLILATQRPSGAVNDNILANTNLRISLRMLDRPESTAVIGSPDAADIPVPLKGRGYARMGPGQLVAFQSAYCGAPLVGDDHRRVLVAPFRQTDDSPRAPSGDDAAGPTHLDTLLGAIGEANRRQALPAPRRPWREVLPDRLRIAEVLADPRADGVCDAPGRLVAIGRVDIPEQQDQRPAIVDLEQGAGLAIFGSGGAGKTTVLRTIAASILATGGETAVVAFDFGSRALTSIAALPNVIDVATGDDLEAVTRHLAVLTTELARRRRLLGDARAEHLTAYNTRHDPLPRIVLLVDGMGAFGATFAGGTGSLGMLVPPEAWLDRFVEIAVEGRQVGMHVVMTADRRSAINTRLHAAISNRLILRHVDEVGYTEHGVPTSVAKALDLPPGRGLWNAAETLQVAAVSADAAADAQASALNDAAAAAPAAAGRAASTLRSAPLPDEIGTDRLPVADVALTAPFGITDVTGEIAVLDLTWSSAIVAGAGRSGRSWALSTLVQGLAKHQDVWAVGSSASGMVREGIHDAAFGRGDIIAPVLERLATTLDAGPSDRPRILAIDDLDALDDPALNPLWDRLSRHDELRVVATMELRAMAGFTTNPLMNAVRRARRALILSPDDSNEMLQAVGVKSPVRPGQRLSPGRGVFIADRRPIVVQVATPSQR
ncbi:MAG: FtsK/SpoIIIE domain-containing protein [Desertimonas sp.]